MKNLNIEALNNEKLKGYCYLPRGIFLPYLNGHVTRSELLLYIYLFAVAVDWDSRHKTCGSIRYSQQELAQSYNTDPSTISKLIKRLEQVGLLFVNDYGLHEIKSYKAINYLMKKKLYGIVDPLKISSRHVEKQEGGDEICDLDEIIQDLELSDYDKSLELQQDLDS